MKAAQPYPFLVFSLPLPITATYNTILGYRKNKTILKNIRNKMLHTEAVAPLKWKE